MKVKVFVLHLGLMAGLLAIGPIAAAHETDQFTLPAGREFADIGRHLNTWAYLTIERGVDRTNRRIRVAKQTHRDAKAIKALQSNEELAKSVNGEFADAYAVIEGMESLFKTRGMKRRYPGKVVGFEKQFGNIYQHVHFPLDPRQFFRIWHASTFMAYGTYMGTDKVGHFTDMGMHYYRAYADALRNGMSEKDAVKKAVRIGTHGPIFSERGMVGYLSAGAYGNADLAANYLGFLFYRNLAEPIELEGTMHPPMVERDGDYWKIAPHVRIDSDFFAAFICDHLNEAFNPSHYESGMRDEIRKALRSRTEVILARHADEHGNRRPREYFDPIKRGMDTYFGQDYGYRGPPGEMVTVANSCFEKFEADAPVASRNASGYTPLHRAAERGDLAAVQRLIQLGADVNVQVRSEEGYSSEWGNTPLHYAAREGHVEVIEFLLDNYANVNATNHRGQSPLHRAVRHPEAASTLVENLALVDVPDSQGQTPLHWAALAGDGPTTQVLLRKGADANAGDRGGRTPLHLAVRSGEQPVVSMIIEHGGYVNAIDQLDVTPLHVAAAGNRGDLIDLLVSKGADVKASDQFGWCALHEAASRGCQTAVQQLLAHGAAISNPTSHATTPLHLAARNGHRALAIMLVDRGANIAAANDQGATPLHEAAFAGQKALVERLLESGADRTAKTVHGQTALDLAMKKQFREITSLLANGHVAAGAR
jgi:ankyrin repeat protein